MLKIEEPIFRPGKIIMGVKPTPGGKYEHEAMRVGFDDLRLHTGIMGATGAGKTVLITSIICQFIKNFPNCPVLMVDLKHDPGMFRSIAATAHMCNRDVQLVNPWGISDSGGILGRLGSCSYNPIMGIRNELALTSAILTAADKGQAANAYWADVKDEIVSTLVTAFLSTGKPFTFNDMWIALESIPALQLLASEDNLDARAKLVISDWLGKATGEPRDQQWYQQFVQGAKMFFRSLGTGTLGEMLNTANPDVTMRKTYTDNRITIFTLPSLLIDHTAKQVGKLLLSELRYLAGALQAETEDRRPFLIVIDEFENLVFNGVQDLFDKGRASGYCMCVAHQTPRQIDYAISREFRDALFANMRNKIVMSTEEYDIAEYFSKLLGKDHDKTSYKINEVTVSATDDYRFGPTVITDMSDFEAIFRLKGQAAKGHVVAFPSNWEFGKDIPLPHWTPTLTQECGINLWTRMMENR